MVKYPQMASQVNEEKKIKISESFMLDQLCLFIWDIHLLGRITSKYSMKAHSKSMIDLGY